jgi:hypothetical protein
MCLRLKFCTHQRVCFLNFLKKSQIRCTRCPLYPCSPVHACIQTAAAVRERRPLRVVAEVRVAEAGKDGARAVVGDVPLGAVGQRDQGVVYRAKEHPRGEALTQRR